jgi:membrane protease YdiL (CAAX protease family)
MAITSPNPRPALVTAPAIAAALAVLITYFGITRWLVWLGPSTSANLLVAQVAAYSALTLGSLALIRWSGADWPFAGRDSLRWIGFASIGVAFFVLIFRFLWKHPPSGWPAVSAQEWREILEGYLIGRMLVPLAEELVFRALLFGFFESGSRKNSVALVIATASGFAALHWPPLYGLSSSSAVSEVLSAFAAGLAFGALRAWTKSILPGMGLHIIGNSLGF